MVVPDMTSHIFFAYEHLASLIAGEHGPMLALFVAFKSHLDLVQSVFFLAPPKKLEYRIPC